MKWTDQYDNVSTTEEEVAKVTVLTEMWRSRRPNYRSRELSKKTIYISRGRAPLQSAEASK